MNEIRKDYLLDRWAIISPDREKRPKQKKGKKKICPFCPGNEDLTPPEKFSIGDPWQLRSIPNKFFALSPKTDLKKSGGFLTNMNGYGFHEVLIESRKHKAKMRNFSDEHLFNVLNTYKKRVNVLNKKDKIEHVFVFRNYGKDAGASLPHPHSQIIAFPFVPTLIKQEIKKSKKYFSNNNSCIFCDILKKERKKRRIYSNNSFVAIAPYASICHGEVWILSKDHTSSITQFDKKKLTDLAEILKKVLKGLGKYFKNPSYKYFLHMSKPNDYYHFHIEIYPKITHRGGVEDGSGVYINELSPEKLASDLKEVVK